MPVPNSHLHCNPTWHDSFLELLPKIQDYVRPAFGHLRGSDHDDAVQEVVAHAFILFLGLMQRGLPERVFPTIIAKFAVAKVRDGRRAGSPRNSRDVMSSIAQRRGKVTLNRLDR